MRKIILIMLILLAFTLLLSCSSAPKQTEEITEKKIRAAENTKFGNSYYNQGQYNKALQFFTLALNDNISVDNEEGIVRSYNSIGKVYMAVGYDDQAADNFSRAVALAEKLGDPVLIAQSRTSLAELYLLRGDLEEAEFLLEEAVLGIGEEDPGQDLAIIYHNIGSLYKKRGMLEEAYDYFQRALEINLNLKQYMEIASNYYMMASIHSKRGDYVLAREMIDQALNYDKRVEHSLGIGKDLFAKGMIEEKAGNYQQAYESFEKSFQVYRAMYLDRDAADVLPYLVSLAERLGKDEEALGYRQLQEQLQGR
jgi:tetratricopeptide (TPR) repeat protein